MFMLLAAGTHHPKKIKFKVADPDAVVEYMEKHPQDRTIDAIRNGMSITRPTAKRVMAFLVDEGRVLVDKDAHPKHFVYSVQGST